MLKRAFTLIELLVVVAIVGVLATLLLPALARAKRQARLIQCKNNLRQFSVATQCYVTDHAAYPLFPFWRSLLPPNTTYSSSVDQHLQTLERCPDDKSHDAFGITFPFGSYGYNWTGTEAWPEVFRTDEGKFQGSARGLGGWFGPDDMRLCLESAVKVPADMIAFGDGIYGASYAPTLNQVGNDDWFSSGRKRDLESVIPKNNLQLAQMAERARHRGRYNVAFCDGHVELIPSEELFSLQDPAQRRWNADHEPR